MRSWLQRVEGAVLLLGIMVVGSLALWVGVPLGWLWDGRVQGLTGSLGAGLGVAAGVALGALGGLELSVREHFAGFRSHSAVLSGACAILVGVPLAVFTSVPQVVILVAGVLTFGVALWRFRAAFKKRSGGLGFRA